MDWNNPTLTSLYTAVLSELKTRDAELAVMFDGVSSTNLPTGTIRWSSSNDRWEKWNGSAWVALSNTVANHIASTSNPHSVTAAQVGAPTTTAFNTHLADTANPHSVTAAQVGAPTTAAFSAHTGNTSNPHATTAGQTGALAITNALSELASVAATARSNIAAASSATLSAHTANTSNPHNVTRAQIGAAASGSNSDITTLTGCTSLSISGSTLTLGTNSSHDVLLKQGGTNRLQMGSNDLYPAGAGGSMNLGTSSKWFNGVNVATVEAPSASGSHLTLRAAGATKDLQLAAGNTHWWTLQYTGHHLPTTNGTQDIGNNSVNPIRSLYFKSQLKNVGTAQTWTFFPYTDTRSIDPNASLEAGFTGSYPNTTTYIRALGHALNSVTKSLETLGLIN